MQVIDYQDKKLAFTNKGEGTPLVFLHGFCEDSRMWDTFSELFLSFQIICIDLPGFGQSELQEAHSTEAMGDCVNAVLEHLNIEHCFLIGHSMGGYASLEFAKKWAHKLMGLCLFHSHPFADTREKKAIRDKGIEFIRKNGHILFVKQLIPKLFAYDFNKGYPFEVNRLIYHATLNSAAHIIAGLEAMRDRPNNAAILESVSCPVLFIIGKKDVAVPYEVSMEQAHLPQLADIQIFEDVGHMGMFEAPRQIAKILKAFIDRTSSTSSN